MAHSNPYMRRAEARKIGESGRSSEKRVAKGTGARLQPASGAMESAKGDMKISRNLKFLAEAKSTVGDTLKIDLEWVTKISREALGAGAKPLLVLSFVTPEGKLRGIKEDWVMMPKSTFDELTGD